MTAIRPMAASDWPQVHAIYAEGIAGGDATFETAPPDRAGFDATRFPRHRFVAHDGEHVVGWVAVSLTSSRAAYRGVVEHSVYVRAQSRGRGTGAALLAAMIDSTETDEIWTIQSGIFPENEASIALHRRAGFRVVGVRERLGRVPAGPLAGRWRDVVLMERRSRMVGADTGPATDADTQ